MVPLIKIMQSIMYKKREKPFRNIKITKKDKLELCIEKKTEIMTHL